jgi:5-methylcytosine-specific restriction endonuclease McrA
MPDGYSIRTALLKRDGNSCFVCGKPMCFDYGPRPAANDATIEHVRELGDGGTWRRDNLALSHKHCNHQRSRYSLFVRRWGEQVTRVKWVMPAWPALVESGL